MPTRAATWRGRRPEAPGQGDIAVMLLGLGSMLVKGGLQYDIDFTGGTLVEVRLAQPAPIGTVRSRLATVGLGESILQVFDDPRDVLIRTHSTSTSPTELSRRIVGALDPDGTSPPEVRRVEFIGPQIGGELRWQAAYAVLAALGGILLYVWLRFDFRGGVVTIVSLAHDVFICLGALSLTNREFSLSVLAALLTVIGFSVNDRIVMYDRLREIRSRTTQAKVPFAQQVNLAVNQTLSRTVLTVATIVLSAGMLFVFGGRALENFGFVILVGALTGTTSTVYVAPWTWSGRPGLTPSGSGAPDPEGPGAPAGPRSGPEPPREPGERRPGGRIPRPRRRRGARGQGLRRAPAARSRAVDARVERLAGRSAR